MSKVKQTEIAWAAGFYDGEGSSKKYYSYYKSKTGKPKKPSQYVCMSVSQCELGPLKRFKKAVNNLGHINGPYHYKAQKRPYWIWAAACSSAEKVFEILKQYLSNIKKKQFRMVKSNLIKNSTRKKGWIYDVK